MSAYDLPWLEVHRPRAYEKMKGFVVAKLDTKARRIRRRRFEKLASEVEVMRRSLRASCPHALESQKYEEHGREDTLGNYKSGRDYAISCTDCGITLASWSD